MLAAQGNCVKIPSKYGSKTIQKRFKNHSKRLRASPIRRTLMAWAPTDYADSPKVPRRSPCIIHVCCWSAQATILANRRRSASTRPAWRSAACWAVLTSRVITIVQLVPQQSTRLTATAAITYQPQTVIGFVPLNRPVRDVNLWESVANPTDTPMRGGRPKQQKAQSSWSSMFSKAGVVIRTCRSSGKSRDDGLKPTTRLCDPTRSRPLPSDGPGGDAQGHEHDSPRPPAMDLVHVRRQARPALPRMGAARRYLPHPMVAPDSACRGAGCTGRDGGGSGVVGTGVWLGCLWRGCLRRTPGAVVLAGLHRPDRGPASRDAWIRTGNAEADAWGSLRARARGSDRTLQADLPPGPLELQVGGVAQAFGQKSESAARSW